MTALLIPSFIADAARVFADWNGLLLPLMLVIFGIAAAVRLLRTSINPAKRHADTRASSRFGHVLVQAFTTNWQLSLLASTALVLSLASGWTTWDGMRNFTGEPILSFMITFGIQGVMLIIAWIIGESFATGMTRRTRDGTPDRNGSSRQKGAAVLGLGVGTVFAVTLFLAIANALGMLDGLAKGVSRGLAWTELADKLLWVVVGLLLLAAIAANRRSDIAQPYVQSARIVARNAVLWVMFLACMATSVFFSFDSLFSSIFPAEERKRAAEIRSINQVAAIVADIDGLMHRRLSEESDILFKSEGWTRYDTHLSALARESQGAEQAIEGYFVQQMEARRRATAEQQERISTALASQAGLVSMSALATSTPSASMRKPKKRERRAHSKPGADPNGANAWRNWRVNRRR